MSQKSLEHLHAVILAGGSGTRLWPLSTQETPKQFLSIGSKESLLSLTAARLRGLISPERIWMVGGEKHAQQALRHLPGVKPERILAEPEAKNTAPAIALAAIQVAALDPEAVLAVLPADHLILEADWETFQKKLRTGAWLARKKNALVTLGIEPTEAATGYGYIEAGDSAEHGDQKYFQVKSFREKPDLKTAEEYLATGRYFWNSGMFLWKATTFLDKLRHYQPAMGKAFDELATALNSPAYPARLAETFRRVENISVDYAVMEKAEGVYVIPAGFSWDDVGSLSSFAKLLSCDAEENYFQGEILAVDSRKNLVIADKPVALVGVEGLIVVETGKALLVISRERVQEVKKVVNLLKKQGRNDLI